MKQKVLLCYLVMLALLASITRCTAAQNKTALVPPPAALEWQFHSIVDALPQKPKFNKGHIPTALSISFTYFDQYIRIIS